MIFNPIHKERDMQVTVIGRHMEVPGDLKRYMQEKAEKLPHYYDRVMAVEILVDAVGGSNRVELVVTVAGHDKFVASEKGNDLFACFDICVDRAEKQLARFKARVRDHKRHARSGQGEA